MSSTGSYSRLNRINLQQRTQVEYKKRASFQQGQIHQNEATVVNESMYRKYKSTEK